MKGSWPQVRLGDLMKRSSATVAIQPDADYREVTVKLWGKGVALRGIASGATIAGGRRFVTKTGQLILSRIDARNGAIGIVPAELDGAVVTNDFPVFDLDALRLDSSFIGWLCKTPGFVELCKRASEGTTNRVRLQEQRFLALEISLPPLTEQRLIVARIEELTHRITEARSLRRETVKQMERLLWAILHSDASTELIRLRELLRLRTPDVIVQPEESYQFAGVYSFGRGVFRGQIRNGMEFAYPRLTRLREGDFVYPKLMAWEGALGVVPSACDGCVVSTEFPVFEIDRTRVLPEVLDIHFRMPSVWPEISGASTGTNVRRRRLNPRDFLAYQMPVPSRETQYRLRDVKAKDNALKRLLTETATELEALVPAILDRAFKGEL